MSPKKIARGLRHSIVDGDLKPGDRLPTREEVRDSSGASPLTVQRAFDRLQKDNFIVSRGRAGTFVSDAPPHLHRYALVYSGMSMAVSRYLELVARCVKQAARPIDQVKIFDETYFSPDCKAYRALLADVRCQRLGGIIFGVAPHALAGSPLLAPDLTIPRVAIMTPAEYACFPTIYPDHRSLIDQSLDELVARGRRKIAVITTLSGMAGYNEYLNKALLTRKFNCPPHWNIPIAPLELNTVASVVRLLFHSGQHERPTGLLFTDAHHLEPAISALMTERVRIPEDVEIVAEANFPFETRPSLPVRRVGFDIQALANRCFELLRRQRQKRATRAFEFCPAEKFEAERHVANPASVNR